MLICHFNFLAIFGHFAMVIGQLRPFRAFLVENSTEYNPFCSSALFQTVEYGTYGLPEVYENLPSGRNSILKFPL